MLVVVMYLTGRGDPNISLAQGQIKALSTPAERETGCRETTEITNYVVNKVVKTTTKLYTKGKGGI